MSSLGTRVALALAFALPGVDAAAQSILTSAEIELSADSVELGAPFHVRVAFDVPPGTLVSFPDTLISTPTVESLAPVTWSMEPSGAGARLTLTYPLIAFRSGDVPVPGLDVTATRARTLAGSVPLPGGSGVVPWTDAPRDASEGVVPLRFVRRAVWVEPAITAEQLRAGVEPMPAADVSGSSWPWPAVGLALVSSLLLVGLALSSARMRRAAGASEGPAREPTLEDARLAALAELDRLLARWGGPTSVREVYVTSSAVVRRYVERFDPEWGPGFTSSELMARLDARAAPALGQELVVHMREAEVVKFGRLRPDPSSAKEHLLALRRWIEDSSALRPEAAP